MLDEIAAHKPTDPIFSLLAQSSQVRPDDTRAAALAKIKAHPNWEADILALLNNRRAYREVYYFLDGNRVDHPADFVGPLNQSMHWLAEDIRTEIVDSNNLQSWSFDLYLVDNLLRAIDLQFPGRSAEFYAGVNSLGKALDAPRPEQFSNVRFTASDAVSNWLRRHR